MPYAERFCQERFCRGCDLGKVEDEEHLLLVCPSTQKVRERFCSTLLAQLMQTTNTAHANYKHGRPGQVCDMLPVPEDNLSSMIYLSSNGLSGPKRTLNCKQ
jgi:hypothetical protein